MLLELAGVDHGAVGGLDDAADRLAEPRVGKPDHHRVAHARMGLERLLDLLGEHLLAARVDAHRAATEQVDRAVGVDGGEVAGHAPSAAFEVSERLHRLHLVLVVADGQEAADGDHPHLAGPGLDPAPVVGEHGVVLGHHEPRRLGGDAGHRDRRAETDRLRRAERVVQDRLGHVAEQAGLVLLAPHHARRRDHGDGGQVVAAGLGVEVLEHRLGERLADDHDVRGPVALDRGEQLGDVEVAVDQRHDGSAEVHRDERRELPGAVHQRARDDHHRAAARPIDALRELGDRRRRRCCRRTGCRRPRAR